MKPYKSPTRLTQPTTQEMHEAIWLSRTEGHGTLTAVCNSRRWQIASALYRRAERGRPSSLGKPAIETIGSVHRLSH